MNADHSVSQWLGKLKGGDREVARPLWERYFGRLVMLARKRLQRAGARRAIADEEDVALSAFDSFCRAAEAGRFPKLEDRDDLWRLLVTVAERKAYDLARDQRRQKRGGGKVLGESALGAPGVSSVEGAGLAQVVGTEPTPQFAAAMAEVCGNLLALLESQGLRAFAVLKMEGYSNEEIGAKMGCALRTVERKLGLIRRTWDAQADGQ